MWLLTAQNRPQCVSYSASRRLQQWQAVRCCPEEWNVPLPSRNHIFSSVIKLLEYIQLNTTYHLGKGCVMLTCTAAQRQQYKLNYKQHLYNQEYKWPTYRASLVSRSELQKDMELNLAQSVDKVKPSSSHKTFLPAFSPNPSPAGHAVPVIE